MVHLPPPTIMIYYSHYTFSSSGSSIVNCRICRASNTAVVSGVENSYEAYMATVTETLWTQSGSRGKAASKCIVQIASKYLCFIHGSIKLHYIDDISFIRSDLPIPAAKPFISRFIMSRPIRGALSIATMSAVRPSVPYTLLAQKMESFRTLKLVNRTSHDKYRSCHFEVNRLPRLTMHRQKMRHNFCADCYTICTNVVVSRTENVFRLKVKCQVDEASQSSDTRCTVTYEQIYRSR